MKKVIINRFKITSNYTLGHCYIEHSPDNIEYIGCSLERGWKDNQSNISCVPEGNYDLKLEYSPKFKKDLWELYGVPNRAECKFHAANYWRQLDGCIALGNKHIDIDGDGDPDVTSSKITMDKFHKAMEGYSQAKIQINNVSYK
tara:strand:- start:62317 stop:62748 length:432 start_codon:yes stop_codon:yes gene_type:complete